MPPRVAELVEHVRFDAVDDLEDLLGEDRAARMILVSVAWVQSRQFDKWQLLPKKECAPVRSEAFGV